jgi:protein involved in polysaccharide export with SLBB domain
MTRRPLPFLVFAVLALLGPAAALRAQNPPPLPDSKTRMTYKIATNDILIVNIFGEPNLDVKSRVDASGRLNCTLIGPIFVYGLTIEQAQAAIEKAYQDDRYIRFPKATVTVAQLAPRQVSVTGAVKNAGLYPLQIETEIRVSDIIVKAGGFDQTADSADVKVTRIMSDGTPKVFRINLRDKLHGRGSKASDDDLVLEPGDLVYVPQRLI